MYQQEQTSRVILDLLNEEGISGACSGRVRIFEKVMSIAKVRLKNCLVHKHIYLSQSVATLSM